MKFFFRQQTVCQLAAYFLSAMALKDCAFLPASIAGTLAVEINEPKPSCVKGSDC